MKPITSVTRRQIPHMVNKRVRYRHAPMGFGGMTYRMIIPPGKDRPD